MIRLLSLIWHWLAPPVRAPSSSQRAGGAADYMELIVGSRGHIYIFRVRDRQSRDLLLPAVMRWAVNDELPFDDDDAAAVVYEAVDAWERTEELCRGM